MKIAVVYSGQVRTYEQCWENHKAFLDGFKEIHTYHSGWSKDEDDVRLIHKYRIDTGMYPWWKYDVDYRVPDRPDLWMHEQDLLFQKKNHPIFMLGRIQYMTSRAFDPIAYDLTHNSVDFPYDLVVRLRYDFKYKGRLIEHVPLREGSLDPEYYGTIFVTRKAGGKSNARNVWDGFAFGHPNVMFKYFQFHNWIPFSLEFKDIVNWKFQPEYVLGTYLLFSHLKVLDSGIQPIRVPVGGDEKSFVQQRTIQYYRDLLDFHPNYWGQIENDCPYTSDELITETLRKEGYEI